jgi:hypothetical protein
MIRWNLCEWDHVDFYGVEVLGEKANVSVKINSRNSRATQASLRNNATHNRLTMLQGQGRDGQVNQSLAKSRKSQRQIPGLDTVSMFRIV